jgi:hypothetical protein
MYYFDEFKTKKLTPFIEIYITILRFFLETSKFELFQIEIDYLHENYIDIYNHIGIKTLYLDYCLKTEKIELFKESLDYLKKHKSK